MQRTRLRPTDRAFGRCAFRLRTPPSAYVYTEGGYHDEHIGLDEYRAHGLPTAEPRLQYASFAFTRRNTPADQCFHDDLLAEFELSGGNIRMLFESIAAHDVFQLVRF